MVFLQFEVQVEAEFEAVWGYFSNFANISAWDPNVKSCNVVKKSINQIGSVYDIVSIFNGKQSTVIYETKKYEQSNDRGSINLFGTSARITADDQITCIRKGPKKTTIIYRADICLRHILCILTPCIKGGLQKLAIQARQGCVKKSIQNWGKAK